MDPVLNLEAKKLIWIAEPWLGLEEAAAVANAVTDNWISQGPRVKEFEQKVANQTGKTYGSACNSGTTALHLALHVCDVGPGDEVIIPNLTMIALANAVLLTGATPVFADSSAYSEVGNLDFLSVYEQITKRTKAVILVHTYGEPVEEIEKITDYCHRNNIDVIEDCAECHFGQYKDRPLGSFGDVSIFSFYSNKNITTGEGGMVTTDCPDTKARLDRVRMHAFTPGQHFCHTERAFGYRMTDMQAAIGLEQLKRAPDFMKRRAEIRIKYEEGLGDVPHLTIPVTTEHSAYWVMPLLADSLEERDNIRQHIASHGIDSRTYFQPMSEQVFLKEFVGAWTYPHSEELASRGFYVPLYPKLADESIEYIIDVLRSYKPCQ
jgi:perosamine synthetase